MTIIAKIVKTTKAQFNLPKAWKVFYNFQCANGTPPEVHFANRSACDPELRNRKFSFGVGESIDRANGKPILVIAVSEEIKGTSVIVCNACSYKDANEEEILVMPVNGNLVSEDFVKRLLSVSEATVRLHPDYKEPK